MRRRSILCAWRAGACVLLGLSACVTVGCGGQSQRSQAQQSEDAPQQALAAGLGKRHAGSVAPAAEHARCAAVTTRVATSRFAVAAIVERRAAVLRAPRVGAPLVTHVDPVGARGLPHVLGVIGARAGQACAPAWYRVQLSILPNGSTGWVRASDVSTYRVRSRIVVDLSQRSLRLFHAGQLALETKVAVGAQATPTPVGRFFVNERYVLPDDSGPFGPNALGVSAHSPTLQDSWVENGPIAIHGTNEPWSLGSAASHGCIRVSNDVMRRLFPLAPAGTPVVVIA